jgi:hypothetical protein
MVSWWRAGSQGPWRGCGPGGSSVIASSPAVGETMASSSAAVVSTRGRPPRDSWRGGRHRSRARQSAAASSLVVVGGVDAVATRGWATSMSGSRQRMSGRHGRPEAGGDLRPRGRRMAAAQRWACGFLVLGHEIRARGSDCARMGLMRQ